MASQVLEEVRSQVQSLFKGGSRYQTEKIATLAAYVLIVGATLVWTFSGEDSNNELGASWGFETIEPLNDKLLFLENTSDDAWSRVRVVLNRQYLYTIPEVEADQRLTIRPEDFDYYFYIPRPWGRSSWEALAESKKPGKNGDPEMEAALLEVRARQGRLNIDLTKTPESPR